MSTKRKTGSVDLSDLIGGTTSASDGQTKKSAAITEPVTAPAVAEQGTDGVFLPAVPVDSLVANPYNPRDRMGDLDDLSTIADMQLQPGTAVTRAAFLALYPDDGDAIGDATYIVINGCRRLAAARHFGVAGLDVVVRDRLAESRATMVTAAVIENIARENLDVIEEAKAVELLVQSSPSAAAAARMLGRTGAWVSQRRALLNLAPELQEKLRAGELGVRDARALTRVPLQDQVDAWLNELEARENPEPLPDPEPEPDAASSSEDDEEREEPDAVEKIVRALRGTKADPALAVAALEEFFDSADLVIVGGMLGK